MTRLRYKRGLPDPSSRMTCFRKREIIKAVYDGKISMAEALERYSMSKEEFLSMELALEENGVKALKASAVRRNVG